MENEFRLIPRTIKVALHWGDSNLPRLYIIEMTTDEFLEIKIAHGHYLNTQVEDKKIEEALNKVSFALGDRDQDNLDFAKKENIPESWVGKWADIPSMDSAYRGPVDAVFFCGYVD